MRIEVKEGVIWRNGCTHVIGEVLDVSDAEGARLAALGVVEIRSLAEAVVVSAEVDPAPAEVEIENPFEAPAVKRGRRR